MRRNTGTSDDYLYLNPTTHRWDTSSVRGADLRLKRTIIYSWSDYNLNQIERRVDEQWQPVTLSEYDALSRLEQGHQWTVRPLQKDDGAIHVEVMMARVADEELARFAKLNTKYVMQQNFVLDFALDLWERVRDRALAYGVDLVDLSVNVTEAEEAYREAQHEWQQLIQFHERALALVRDMTFDGLVEMESIVEQAREVSRRYLAQRNALVVADHAIQNEPGRLPEKASLASWVQELPAESPLTMIVALSKVGVKEQAVSLHVTSPREKQAALIAELLNDFFGQHLATADCEEIILYDDRRRPAAVIAKGELRPYREK